MSILLSFNQATNKENYVQMKIINIKNKTEALMSLERFRLKEQSGVEIKLINVHLCEINALVGEKIFSKNDLYVTGETLYEIMQPIGDGHGRHHYHGLSPKLVLETLNNAKFPYGIYKAGNQRYVIVTISTNITGENVVLIVEIGASLKGVRDANINKLVSIYPRRNIDKKINENKGSKFR